MTGAVGSTNAAGSSGVDPKLAKATQDFEAMLLSELLKIGDDESPQGELDSGSAAYQDLRNQAIARALASNGGIGIGRMLRRHFGAGNEH